MCEEPVDESLEMRIGKAIQWLWSSEAGPLKVCEARYLIRERFGADVAEFLRYLFGERSAAE